MGTQNSSSKSNVCDIMRTSFAVAFLSAALSAKQTMAKLVRGQDWAFRMNEAPAECKAYSAQPWNCAAQNMWHPLRSHNAEYYVHDSYQNGNQDGRLSFADAIDFCASEALNKPQADGTFIQSELVSIHDEVERNFIISLQANNRHGFWVGVDGRDSDLYDTGTKQQEGFKTYLDGTAVDYTSWAPGEPNSARYGTKINGQPSGDLVDTWMDECIFQGLNKGNPALWNDAACHKRKRVVCKRTLTAQSRFPDGKLRPTCNGLPDPPECRNYYDAKCGASISQPDDNFNFGAAAGDVAGNGPVPGPYWSSVCPLKCNTCDQSTTTMVSTTTTDATTSTTAGKTTSTTDAPTTTTTFRSTTTTVETTTTTFQSTTTTVETTTTTFVTTTTTTEAPRTTTTQDSGVCNTRGWSDVSLNQETGISCCYKYNSKPRLSFMAAEQSCNEIADNYPQVSQVVSHLASPYTNYLNEILVELRNNKPGKANAETAWIGANLFNANGTVEWVNDYFKIYNGNYAKGSHGSDFNITDKYPLYREGAPCDPGFQAGASPTDADVRKAKFFPTNGMFYRGEPSGKDMNFGNRGNAEECVMVGSDKFRTKFVGDNFWNDGKCGVKRSYFCEFCYKMVTTTTAEPTSSTTELPTTSTPVVPSTPTPDLTTSTTEAPLTTTVVPSTTTTDLTTSTTEAPLTTTTTSTAAPDCGDILCSTDCGEIYDKKKDMRNWESHCGWSSKRRACIVGGKTSPKELAQGQCDGETTTKATTKPPSADNTCAEIYCSTFCGVEGGNGIGGECRTYVNGESGPCLEYKCGWSRKHDRCLTYPARTNEKEANGEFGPQCPETLPGRH